MPEGARVISILRKDFYDLIKREPASSVKILWAFVQVLGQRLHKATHGEGIAEPEDLFQD
jgi:hypothetical protein